jgi:hypothetical protein
MRLPAKSRLGLLELIDRLNPKRCRLIARVGKRAMSSREIADRSGLTVRHIERLSVRETWRGVDIEVIEAFRTGCGITIANENRMIRYLIRTFAVSRRPLYHIKDIKPKLRRKLLS